MYIWDAFFKKRNILFQIFQATAKYHEMLNSVREFMTLNEVPRTLCERVLDYVVSKWANTKGVDQVNSSSM